MKYKIKVVADRVCCIECVDMYDMSMTFLRYQEFYESLNPKFRIANTKGEYFTIIEIMEWYSRKWGIKSGKGRRPGPCFTYAADFLGFNLPSHKIKELLYGTTGHINDWNKYDDLMLDIYNQCRVITGSEDFYMIGVLKDHDAIEHELAHGFYYTVPEYKKKMDAAYKALPKITKDKITKHLITWGGYSRSVIKDETQAFLSTGFDNLKIASKYCKPFEKIYKGQKKWNQNQNIK
jgi:hypothetical protein